MILHVTCLNVGPNTKHAETFALVFFAVGHLLQLGSFHIKSTDFWPFFHGPLPILLKFGTLEGIV